MSGSPTPVGVFYAYAPEDVPWRTTLEKHLSLLQQQGLISHWSDRHTLPGTDWAQAIDEHLERASIILLLISADFLASDYCYGVEMKRAMERHQANEARVIPILLLPVDWKSTPFAHLQALPTDAKPITSWRNRDAAFRNVVAGIRRAIEDLSSLQASTLRAALPPVWNVPYPRNAFFIGREALLVQLRQHLQAGNATALSQPQALGRLGGIGKTQIAVEYAYRFYQNYRVVLWARAESQEALTSSYVTIASLLNLPEQEVQKQEITVQAVRTWLQTHSGWLLVLDNADDLALVPAFLPPVMEGHLLLTTRGQAMGGLAHRIEVETFSPEDGALFLLRRAALFAPDAGLSQASTMDRELALQITQELGGLPMALDQAGTYLEETGSSLADYQQLYQQYHMELLKKRVGLVTDHPEAVATTCWSLSFACVEARNPAAADLLRSCAYLAPDAIPEEIITLGAAHLGPRLTQVAADALLLGQAMEALRAYSLIGRNPGIHTLSVHRLVQAVVREALDEAERQCWAERAIRAVDAVLPAVEHANWTQWERLLAHAQACVGWIEQERMAFSEAARLLNQTGFYLQERARYQEAEPLLERALAIREQQLGETHPDTATSLNSLAVLYHTQGKYEQAEPLLERALAIREQQLGETHPDTATNLNNLAELYKAQGKYEQAEPLLQRALAIYEQQLGPEHPDTASSLGNLAALYYTQGKYEQAEPLFQRALAIDEKALGLQHQGVATDLNNLAELYRVQGKYEQAEPLLRRALAIDEKVLGLQHPSVANSLNNLALLYEAQSKYGKAEPLYRRALTICEQQLGSQHSNTQSIRKNYASLLRTMGRDAEAALEAKRMPPFQEIDPEEISFFVPQPEDFFWKESLLHPKFSFLGLLVGITGFFALKRLSVAMILELSEDLKQSGVVITDSDIYLILEAIDELKELQAKYLLAVLAYKLRYIPKNKQLRAACLFYLGYVSVQLDKQKQALLPLLECRQICLEIGFEQTLVHCNEILLSLYAAWNMSQEVIDLLEEKKSWLEKKGNLLDLASTNYTLATAYYEKGEYRNALACFGQAKDILIAVANDAKQVDDYILYSRQVAKCYQEIAKVCQEIGKHEQAVQNCETAKSIFLRLPVSNKRDLANCDFALAYNYYWLNQSEKALELYQQARAIEQEEGSELGVALCDLGMAWIYDDATDTQETALQLYEQARLVFDQHGDQETVQSIDRNIAKLKGKRASHLRNDQNPINKEASVKERAISFLRSASSAQFMEEATITRQGEQLSAELDEEPELAWRVHYLLAKGYRNQASLWYYYTVGNPLFHIALDEAGLDLESFITSLSGDKRIVWNRLMQERHFNEVDFIRAFYDDPHLVAIEEGREEELAEEDAQKAARKLMVLHHFAYYKKYKFELLENAQSHIRYHIDCCVMVYSEKALKSV